MDLNFKDPEQIKQLISLLQNLLPEENKEEEEEEEFSSKIKTKTRSSKSKNNAKNKFLQMPERNMHKDDIEIDKKLAVNAPTPRTRKFEPVNVRCRVCGKQEKVNPGIVADSVDRYKCNKCAGSAGG